MNNIEILKKLYNEYTKSFLPKILLSVLFSLLVAASTSAIAWLLDPAIKKIFIEKDQTLILLIPAAIIIAFSTKGISLYIAKTIAAGIRSIKEVSFSINIFFIAGSNSQAIAEVLAATNKENRTDSKIFGRKLFVYSL